MAAALVAVSRNYQLIEETEMGCGCGGGNAGQGGCGGQQAPLAPALEAAAVQEVMPVARPSADEPEAFVDASAAAPLLIASSEQDWPRVRVNGVLISPEAMAQELQYHPAEARDEAMFLAAQALVIRELLRQRCNALDLEIEAGAGESEEEATIRSLIEREVPVPQADEAACLHYYESNLARFVSAPLLAARHILLDCAPDDIEGRSERREQAEALLAQLQQEPQRFAELALAHSACPSKEQGGALGQISKGQTVPEFERQLFRQPEGLVGQPLESRYGFHLVFVDQRIDGLQLPYQAVVQDIRRELYQRVWQKAVAQYLQTLVGAADIQGIRLEGAASPLLQ